MEVLAPVLETMVVKREMESSVLFSKVVAVEKEIEPPILVSKTVSLEADILGQEDSKSPRLSSRF